MSQSKEHSNQKDASIPADHRREKERLASLHASNLLDSQPGAQFDRITRLAQTIFDVEVATISLIDVNRQWFLSKCGLDAKETSREVAFCAHAIHEDEILVIEDARADERFKDNPLVTGSPYIRFYAGAVLRDPEGLPLGTLCIFDPRPRKMSEREERTLIALLDVAQHEIFQTTEDTIERASMQLKLSKDPVTNAYWEHAFADEISRISTPESASSPYCIAALEGANFPVISRAYGRAVGDEILYELSNRVQRFFADFEKVVFAITKSDRLITYFSDSKEEFTSEKAQHELLRKLKEALLDPFRTSVEDFTPNINVVFISEEASHPYQEVLKSLDISLDYLQKNKGIQYEIVSPWRRAQSERFFEVTRGLDDAIFNDKLRLVYQPKVRSVDQNVVGFEALLRWNHPTLGVVSPLEIVESAKESGKMLRLDQWVIDSAAREFSRWERQGLFTAKISVNISADTIQSKEFHSWLRLHIDGGIIKPSCIDIEIVESSIIEDFDSVVEAMHKIIDMGFSFSLDDFGTGYSSLAYLKQLPISTLKIDKSFINEIVEEQKAASMCLNIIRTARDMGMTCLAEGVESVEQFQLVRAFHCEQIQGYYFSEPIEVSEIHNRIDAFGAIR
ncbi:EAL domain-containing protein [Pseudidiomarina halophila]|uniref:Sensor domain-containing phosphodiesterase n=1 Tax=Pseudidiomarina halophila TaxID=1449799 RepID=A0A432Y014_9GAMM|nr:sensor domain-containing phosphodiesterase [Pseudidiomarina halophila]RUO54286.1 sensor domain-containing phosphodiesterase [Pseudidiomarina halophila]